MPSTVVLPKRVNTMDTQFANSISEFVDRPLEYNVGIFDFGKFRQVDEDEEFAWEKINDMWDESLNPDDSDSETDESEAE